MLAVPKQKKQCKKSKNKEKERIIVTTPETTTTSSKAITTTKGESVPATFTTFTTEDSAQECPKLWEKKPKAMQKECDQLGSGVETCSISCPEGTRVNGSESLLCIGKFHDFWQCIKFEFRRKMGNTSAELLRFSRLRRWLQARLVPRRRCILLHWAGKLQIRKGVQGRLDDAISSAIEILEGQWQGLIFAWTLIAVRRFIKSLSDYFVLAKDKVRIGIVSFNRKVVMTKTLDQIQSKEELDKVIEERTFQAYIPDFIILKYDSNSH